MLWRCVMLVLVLDLLGRRLEPRIARPQDAEDGVLAALQQRRVKGLRSNSLD